MPQKIYFVNIMDGRDLHSANNFREEDGFEFGRLYYPTDIKLDEAIKIYHVDLGFLRGAATVEVITHTLKKAMSLEFCKFRVDFKILGAPRSIKGAKSKLEKLLEYSGLKLEEDGVNN